jgi:hypothetical protein
MAVQAAKRKPAAPKVRLRPRKVAAHVRKPRLPKGARRPRISAVRAGLARVRRLFKSQIEKARGKEKQELTAAYQLWNRRTYLTRKNLAAGNKAAVHSADMLIRMGEILAKSGSQEKHLNELMNEVKRNVAGHSSNKGFITKQLRGYMTSLSEARQSIIAFLKSPNPRSLGAAARKLRTYQENSPKLNRALKFYEEALYFQARHIVVLAKAKALRTKINQRIRITKDAMEKGLLPRDEGKKIIKQLRILKKNIGDIRVRNYKIRLKRYMLQDAVKEKNGKIRRNHRFWDDLLASEKRYGRISGMVEAVSWQSMLAKEVNRYYAKGYWKMPAGTPERERSRKIIRMYIQAGREMLKRKNIPTFVEKNKGGKRYIFGSGIVNRLRSLKKGVLAELNKLEAIVFKGKVGDAKRVLLNMSADNLKADEVIAKTVYEKMDEHFDDRTLWEKYKHVVADVAVIGLGIIGSIASGGIASPFIAAAEAAYFAGRFATDMVGSYMVSGKLPGVFEVLGAAAMTIIPAGRFLKGAAGARRMRTLGKKFGFSLRATKHLITTRLAGQAALKEAGKFAYVDTVSNLAGKYLLGSAAIGMMLDRSVENLMTNAVFLAMGIGHGLTARMQARAAKKYAVEINETLAAMRKIPPPIPLGAYVPVRLRAIPRRIKGAAKVGAAALKGAGRGFFRTSSREAAKLFTTPGSFFEIIRGTVEGAVEAAREASVPKESLSTFFRQSKWRNGETKYLWTKQEGVTEVPAEVAARPKITIEGRDYHVLDQPIKDSVAYKRTGDFSLAIEGLIPKTAPAQKPPEWKSHTEAGKDFLAHFEAGLPKEAAGTPQAKAVELLRQEVRAAVAENKGSRITYHNERHLQEMYEFAERVMGNDPLARVAITLHDVGYFLNERGLKTGKATKLAANHENLAMEYVWKNRKKLGLSDLQAQIVMEYIKFTKLMDVRDGKTIPLVDKTFQADLDLINKVYTELKKNIPEDKLSADVLKYLKSNFSTADLSNPSHRKMLMGMVQNAKGMAVADIYAQAKHYIDLVSGLRNEFIFDQNKTAAPTNLEQIGRSYGFLVFFAGKGRVDLALKGTKDVPGLKVPKSLQEAREKNLEAMHKVNEWIETLKERYDQKAYDALKKFIDARDEAVMGKDVKQQMYAELDHFAQRGRAMDAIRQEVGIEKGKSIFDSYKEAVEAGKNELAQRIESEYKKRFKAKIKADPKFKAPEFETKTYKEYVAEYEGSDLLSALKDASKRKKIARTLAVIRLAAARASKRYGRKIRVFLIGGLARDLARGKSPNDVDMLVSEGEIVFYSELKKAYQEATGLKVRVRKLSIPLSEKEGEYTSDVRTIEVVKEGGKTGADLLEPRLLWGLPKHYQKGGPQIDKILKYDASQRDLTINSVYLEIDRFSKSGLIDPTGSGIKDLSDNVIRFNDRTKQLFRSIIRGTDATVNVVFRLFRAYDFAGRTGAKIEAETKKLMAGLVDASSKNPKLRQVLRTALIRALKEGKGKAPRIMRGLQRDGLLGKMPKQRESTNPIILEMNLIEVRAIREYLRGEKTLSDLHGMIAKRLFLKSLYASLKSSYEGSKKSPGLRDLLADKKLTVDTAIEFLMNVNIKNAKEVRAIIEILMEHMPQKAAERGLLSRMSHALEPDRFFALDKSANGEARSAIETGKIKPKEFNSEKTRVKKALIKALLEEK